MAGVNKHWVMLNVVLCKSFWSRVFLGLGLQWAHTMAFGWIKYCTEVTLSAAAASVPAARAELCLLPSDWHILLVTSCYSEVMYISTLFLKCLHALTFLLNQIMFSRVNCLLIALFLTTSIYTSATPSD